MIKTTTVLDKDVQSTLIQNNRIFWIVMLCVESVLLVPILILSVILSEYFYFVISLCLEGFYIIMLISLNKLVKNCKSDIVNSYEFNEDHFIVTSTRNNEKIGESKVYYRDLIKKKIKNDYLFLYLNRQSAFPVKLSKLQDYEIKILKSWLGINKLDRSKNDK